MTTSDRKLKLKLAQLVRCNGFTVYVNGAWEMNAATRRKAWRVLRGDQYIGSPGVDGVRDYFISRNIFLHSEFTIEVEAATPTARAYTPGRRLCRYKILFSQMKFTVYAFLRSEQGR